MAPEAKPIKSPTLLPEPQKLNTCKLCLQQRIRVSSIIFTMHF